MSRRVLAILLLGCLACAEERSRPTGRVSAVLDAAATPGDAGALDANALDAELLDEGSADGAISPDVAIVDAGVDASNDAATGPVVPRLARGLVLESVAIWQSVKVDLVRDGQERRPRNAPVIADRGALLRLYVRPTGPAAPVTAALTIGGERFTQVRTIRAASVETDSTSLFTFEVPARLMQEGVRWSAQLESATGPEISPGVADDARWPRDGSDSELRAQTDGGGLRLMLVPMRYDTDGSGRLPDTSSAQLDRFRALLGALYPVAQIELTVHAPVAWSRALYPTGNVNFDRLNDLLTGLRSTENVPADVYMYALITPASTFSAYCGGSCVTGQSYVPQDPRDADIRVGGGMGYSGNDAAWTLVHEVGHMHGRYHAPCAVSSWDPAYPYLNGDVGVWGYDVRDDTIVAPGSGFTDFMGYCRDRWISDYTYAAIFRRVIEQRGGMVRTRPRPWTGRMITQGPEGWTIGGVRSWSRRPSGEAVRVEHLDAWGRVVGWGEATRLLRSHEESAQWLMAPPPRAAVQTRIAGAGTFAWQSAAR